MELNLRERRTSMIGQQHPQQRWKHRNSLMHYGDTITLSERRCRNSRRKSRGKSSNPFVTSPSRVVIQRSNSSMASLNFGSKKLSKHNILNLQDLPQDVLLHIVDLIDLPSPHKDTTLVALSETSRTMNDTCHMYLLRRWEVSSTTTMRMADEKALRKDGVIQRLQLEDPKEAFELFTEYIKGGDENGNNANSRRKDRFDISRSIRSKIFLEASTEMIQVWTQLFLQPSNFIIDNIYRKFVDRHVLHDFHIQEEYSALLCRVTILTLMIGPVICLLQYDNVAVAINNGNIYAVVVFLLCCLCMLIGTNIASGTQLNRVKYHQLQQRDGNDTEGNVRSTYSLLDQKITLRRSYSQPEFMSFTTANITKCTSIPTNRPNHLASSRPASFRKNDAHMEVGRNCSVLAMGYNQEEGTMLTYVHHVPATELSFDYGYSSEEDEPGSFVFADEESEGMEIARTEHTSDVDQVVSSRESTFFRNGCFICPTKNVFASTHSSTGFESMVLATLTRSRGWVGMYRRALHLAKKRILHLVNDSRLLAYKTLNVNERNDLSSSLMNACIFDSDDAVSMLRLLSKSIPTQDFYIGIDGTETCALHTAAFHGSSKIIDFLCSDIDTTYYYCDRPSTFSNSFIGSSSFTYNDGGLCDVNVTDMNGWTPLHYAVGSNIIEAVRVLLKYGALLHLAAANGYTPLQWALRLQHISVANELRSSITVNQQEEQRRSYWYSLLEKGTHSLFTIIFLSLFIIPIIGLVYMNSDSVWERPCS